MKLIFGILILIGVSLSTIFLVYLGADIYDIPCLNNFGENYCSSNNMSFNGIFHDFENNVYKKGFTCNDHSLFNERTNPGYIPRSFYFLPLELNECRIKNPWSLKVLK